MTPTATVLRPRPALPSPGRAPEANRARSLAAWGLWLFTGANAGAIVWLWLHGGGVTGVHGTADLLTSLGRITGLLGAYLALIQVLLLARLPPLERLVGFDRLAIWHRRNGKTCLLLLLAHTILITIGYAGTDKLSVPHEASQLLDTYPGILTATVGTGLLLVVVISSFVIARRRLPYEAWYALHLTTYAGIALAWSHQIPTGNELSTSHAAQDYWYALYLGALALLVCFRFARPIGRGLRHRLRVLDVVPEGPNVVSVRLGGRRLDRLEAHGGQFFLWRFLTPGRWWQAHPFSLSAAPDGSSLRITVKGVGNFSRRLRELTPGTRVLAEGPFGRFTLAARHRRRVLMIAGGIGITPIRAMLEELARAGEAESPADGALPVLLYRVIHEQDLVFRAELDALAEGHGVTVHYVVGDHRDLAGRELLSPQHLEGLVPDVAERDVYVCGPVQMMRAVHHSLRACGVRRPQIHSERFALAL